MALWIFGLAATVVVVWIAKFIYQDRRERSRLPPGPPGKPIIGNMFQMMGENRQNNLMNAGKKFGGIFTLQIGVQYSVVITSYRLFREAVIDKAWEFAGRPPEVRFGDLQPGIIAGGVDTDDREVRRFTLLTLRSFGFGKADMENIILQEADTLIDHFRNTNGAPFNPRLPITNAAANVISAILLGKSFQYGDPEFRVVSEAMTEGIKLVLVAARRSSFPILNYLPLGKVKKFIESFRSSVNFLKKVVREHEDTRVPDVHRDFIDAWLDHAQKPGSPSGQAFTAEKLESSLLDLFGGGFETTATTLQWTIAMLLHHPEVQDKIHETLDRSTSRGAQITLQDREALAYVEAVIWETLRMYTVIPFAVPHMSTEDAAIGRYTIPKDTRVVLHLHSIHHDPDLWEEPETFKPERFVVNGKLHAPDYFIPFSAGRRSCIGEQLARKEVFLVFANLMQNFIFSVPKGQGLPSLKMNDAVVMYPDPFDVVVTPR
ncbi:cytochrome P450 2J6-like [Paramacrobiotus metropolitanus]|uniref:cytochrome P450 2J6-like n=1 Tax=Paramacrobiotus metropolitanus TaxID=2943436 RepID=UPI002445E33F|nr:cytochrome P450 2J6-like [Paramacrobiotus metropolitanus]